MSAKIYDFKTGKEIKGLHNIVKFVCSNCGCEDFNLFTRVEKSCNIMVWKCSYCECNNIEPEEEYDEDIS